MHFCDKCGNMYYIRIDEQNENNIIYYCRRCGNENKELGSSMKNICVSINLYPLLFHKEGKCYEIHLKAGTFIQTFRNKLILVVALKH